MDIETFRTYCLTKKAVEESFPFDEHTLVFKLMGKIFAILPLDEPNPRANLKADPDLSTELRERHPQIIPGIHMNKKHWNTIMLDEGLDDALIRELIDHSYQLILDKLPKKSKDQVNEL